MSTPRPAAGDIGDPAYDVSLPNHHRIVVARLDGPATNGTTVAPLNPGGPLASAGGPSLLQQGHQDASSDPRREIERTQQRCLTETHHWPTRSTRLPSKPWPKKASTSRPSRPNPHTRCPESLRRRHHHGLRRHLPLDAPGKRYENWLLDDPRVRTSTLFEQSATTSQSRTGAHRRPRAAVWRVCSKRPMLSRTNGRTGQCQTVRLRISILLKGLTTLGRPAADKINREGRKVQVRSCHERAGESVVGAAARRSRLAQRCSASRALHDGLRPPLTPTITEQDRAGYRRRQDPRRVTDLGRMPASSTESATITADFITAPTGLLHHLRTDEFQRVGSSIPLARTHRTNSLLPRSDQIETVRADAITALTFRRRREESDS